MQVFFLPSEQLPDRKRNPCIKLGGVLYCDYQMLKLPPAKIRQILVAHKLKPERETVRFFGLQSAGKKLLVVARRIVAPLEGTSSLSQYQFQANGKWWEVMYSRGAPCGYPKCDDYPTYGIHSGGFKSGIISWDGVHSASHKGRPNGLNDTPINLELPFLPSYPNTAGDQFSLLPITSRPFTHPTINEELLFARLQKKFKPLKAVKRMRNKHDWKNTLDNAQMVLDVAGMVPVIGNAADLINLCLSLGRGNYGEAALNAASMIPGSQLLTGAKLAIRSGRRYRKAGRMRLKRREGRERRFSGKKKYREENTDDVNLDLQTHKWSKDEYEIVKGKRLPRTKGRWTGERGESIWKSDIPEVNEITEGKGIEFRNGYPDFSEWSLDEYVVDGLTGNNTKDFSLVYEKMLTNKDYDFKNVQDVKNFLQDNRITLHHHEDGKTIQLIFTDLHGNIPHQGGAAILRSLENLKHERSR